MTIRVIASDDFRRLSNAMKLAANDKKILRELRKEFRKAGRSTVNHLRRVIRKLPVKGVPGGGSKARRRFNTRRKKHGLRAAVASGVAVKTLFSGKNAGVEIVVKASGLPPDQRNLPRYLNTRKGWRHPLFGNEDRWFAQTGTPYFQTTIFKHLPEFRRGAEDAIEKAIRSIT